MSAERCSDCPPAGYPTDKTRCDPCPERGKTGDGVPFVSAKHPTADISDDALETMEIDLPVPRSLMAAYGENAVLTDNLIMSEQLLRIESVLLDILRVLRK